MLNSSENLVSKAAYMLATASLLAVTPTNASYKKVVLSDMQSSISSSYQGDYYFPKATTSNQYAPVHITKDALFDAEIDKFKQLISTKFNTRVTETWVPAKDLEEKTCLFIKCDLQNDFSDDFEKLSDFELSLYLSLKEELNESQFFNMIALF